MRCICVLFMFLSASAFGQSGGGGLPGGGGNSGGGEAPSPDDDGSPGQSNWNQTWPLPSAPPGPNDPTGAVPFRDTREVRAGNDLWMKARARYQCTCPPGGPLGGLNARGSVSITELNTPKSAAASHPFGVPWNSTVTAPAAPIVQRTAWLKIPLPNNTVSKAATVATVGPFGDISLVFQVSGSIWILN